MATKMSVSDILALSVEERIRLVQDIWDSIAGCPQAVELTDAQRQELDARIEAYHKDPAAGSCWDTVKARVSQNG